MENSVLISQKLEDLETMSHKKMALPCFSDCRWYTCNTHAVLAIPRPLFGGAKAGVKMKWESCVREGKK